MEETIKNKEERMREGFKDTTEKKDERLTQERREQKEILEKDGQAESKEALRKISQSKVKEEEQDWSQEISNAQDTEEKIEKLTRLASVKGPQEAIKIAKKLNENYSLDKLHDEMVDESRLREELIKKGFIKES
jgi:membrane protein involved in colicin uptake